VEDITLAYEVSISSAAFSKGYTYRIYILTRPVTAPKDAMRKHYEFFFCCPDGMVGLLPSSGVTGICREKGLNIPSSMLATIASQIGGTVGVTITGAPTGTRSGLSGSTDKPDSSGSTKLTPSEPTTGSNGPGGISIGPIVGIVVGSLVVFALTVTLTLWWH